MSVAVIGGGPAGLAAALAAAEAGADQVVLIERDRRLGGILNQCIHDGFGLHRFKEALSGPEYAARYIEMLGRTGVRVLLDTIALNLSADRRLLVSGASGLREIEADAVVLAMGCRERARGALSIPGHRPSGVYTAGAAQNFVNMENIMPGRNVVILGSGDIGLIMARRMTLEGARVASVFEQLPYSSGLPRNIQQCLADYGIPLHLSTTIVEIVGMRRLEGVRAAAVDEALRPVPGTERFVPCDTLLLSVGLIPENELARDAGVLLDPATGGPSVDDRCMTSVDGIFSCGNALHVHDLVDWVSEEASRAGRAAAEFAAHGARGARPSGGSGVTAIERRIPRKGAFICVVCPNGCEMDAVFETSPDGTSRLASFTGAKCPRGEAWIRQEIESPMRTAATSVPVRGGEDPLASVRTNRPVPLEKIGAVMAVLRGVTLEAPVSIGQIVATNPAGTDTEVIATRNVRRVP